MSPWEVYAMLGNYAFHSWYDQFDNDLRLRQARNCHAKLFINHFFSWTDTSGVIATSLFRREQPFPAVPQRRTSRGPSCRFPLAGIWKMSIHPGIHNLPVFDIV